jgi:hypothetical protein
MHRMALIVVAVFIGILLCGGSLVYAQAQPGGPMPQPPPSQGQPPPGGLRPDGQPNRGRQQPPPDLPAEFVNAPYQGPSTRLPPGVNIPAPRNQEEARAIEAQYRPQLEQAAAQARPRVEAARAMAQRVARGDRSLPTAAEEQLGQAYSLNRPAPPEGGLP